MNFTSGGVRTYSQAHQIQFVQKIMKVGCQQTKVIAAIKRPMICILYANVPQNCNWICKIYQLTSSVSQLYFCPTLRHLQYSHIIQKLLPCSYDAKTHVTKAQKIEDKLLDLLCRATKYITHVNAVRRLLGTH